MGRRERRAHGPRRGQPRSFRAYHVAGDDPHEPRRGVWSATETAIDKWIKRLGTPEMTSTEAARSLLAAADRATREKGRGERGALFYRVNDPPCRLVARHQATGIRILTVQLLEEEPEVEFDDAA